MKMNLRTFGGMVLENSSLNERLPLLLLSYLAIEGKTHRQFLADLFWSHQPQKDRRLQSLSQTIYRLKRVQANLVTIDGLYLSSNMLVDVKIFQTANPQEAIKLYRGPFLFNIERDKRLKLGEELTEWLINKREFLQTWALNLQLEQAETLAFASQFEQAGTLAWQAFTDSTAIAYPNQEVYRRTHTLLLAAEQHEKARVLQQEASDIYGEEKFPLDQPFKARAYLTHTFNLRPDFEDLIGRDKDIQALLALLETSRLITVYGTAGIGKTVLVQALARAARGKPFTADGIHIAYLEGLPLDAGFEILMRHISEALGIPANGKTINLSDLSNFIADQSQLLILDNVEHITKEGLPIIKHLHDTCKNLRIITTSRQHIKLNQETIFMLEPLAFPKDEAVSLEIIHSYGAVQLFERDAKKYGFQLVQEALEDIIKICQMVEGLPLALKLSAAWTNTLTPKQIAQELENNIDVLGAGTHDTPRQTSIHATFDYSLALLSKNEADNFISLGVFGQGFTFEAAQAVTNTSIFILRGLVEKSLLRFDNKTNRYTFHPLLGRYIKELFQKRVDKDEFDAVHARYYLTLLDTVIDEEGNERGEVLPVLKPEMENIDKAWRYATDHAWVEELFRSSRALQNFASSIARYSFADVLLTCSLERVSGKAINLKTALFANLSALKFWVGDHGQAIDLACSAHELIGKSSIEPGRLLSITRLIFGIMQSSYSAIGNFGESLKLSREIFSIVRKKSPNTVAYSNALASLAIQERDLLGNYNPQPFYEALSIAEKHAKTDVPWLLSNLAESLIKIGELEKAEEVALHAEQLAEQMQLNHWLAMSRYYIAITKLQQGKIWEALQICQLLMEMIKEHYKPSLTSIIYQLAAKIEMIRDNKQQAWDYLMKALIESKVTRDIGIENSIKIDLLEWTLRENDKLSLQIRKELEKETARMYFHDLERFTNLQNYNSSS